MILIISLQKNTHPLVNKKEPQGRGKQFSEDSDSRLLVVSRSSAGRGIMLNIGYHQNNVLLVKYTYTPGAIHYRYVRNVTQ